MLVYLLRHVVVSTLSYWSINSWYCLHLRYNEIDHLYQLFALDTSSGEAIGDYQLTPSYN